MPNVRVGLIGCGSIGQLHAERFNALGGADVAAACDSNPGAMQALAGRYGLDRAYPDYEDLLADKEIDAVLVCLPNRLHAPVTISALEAGKHVLCEKPAAMSSQQVQQMFEARDRAGKKLLIGLTRRFGENTRALKACVEAGELGQVYYAKCGYLRRSGIPGMGSWFTTRSEAGAGPIYDVGVHALDLTFWLMGNFKPASVLAAQYAKFGPQGKGAGNWGTPVLGGPFDVEDLATALIRMEDGSAVSFEVSWAAHVGAGQFYSVVLGDKGGADFGSMTVFAEERGRPVDKKLHAAQKDPYEAQARHFVSCILNDEEPITTAEQMIGLQKALDAILESAETGGLVTIK